MAAVVGIASGHAAVSRDSHPHTNDASCVTKMDTSEATATEGDPIADLIALAAELNAHAEASAAHETLSKAPGADTLRVLEGMGIPPSKLDEWEQMLVQFNRDTVAIMRKYSDRIHFVVDSLREEQMADTLAVESNASADKAGAASIVFKEESDADFKVIVRDGVSRHASRQSSNDSSNNSTSANNNSNNNDISSFDSDSDGVLLASLSCADVSYAECHTELARALSAAGTASDSAYGSGGPSEGALTSVTASSLASVCADIDSCFSSPLASPGMPMGDVRDVADFGAFASADDDFAFAFQHTTTDNRNARKASVATAPLKKRRTAKRPLSTPAADAVSARDSLNKPAAAQSGKVRAGVLHLRKRGASSALPYVSCGRRSQAVSAPNATNTGTSVAECPAFSETTHPSVLNAYALNTTSLTHAFPAISDNYLEYIAMRYAD